ncbi:hypothetical protein, partial [Candidatus Symbiothrix dinenymphae]|uniref:hypothetical protein n=1 Tax=Candidatus Symbiothrix dinenymphae TaxID=467085 RepID=UPI000A91FA3E
AKAAKAAAKAAKAAAKAAKAATAAKAKAKAKATASLIPPYEAEAIEKMQNMSMEQVIGMVLADGMIPMTNP